MNRAVLAGGLGRWRSCQSLHLTTACRRLPTASAPASLWLSAAPDAQRWAPRAREAKPRRNSPGQDVLFHLGRRLATRRRATRRGPALCQRMPAPYGARGYPPRPGQSSRGACQAARPAGLLAQAHRPPRQEQASARVASSSGGRGWRAPHAWPRPAPWPLPGRGSAVSRSPGLGVRAGRTGRGVQVGRMAAASTRAAGRDCWRGACHTVFGGRVAAGRGPRGAVQPPAAPTRGVPVRRGGRLPRRGGVVRRGVVGGGRWSGGVKARPGASTCAQQGLASDAQ